jgi:hypothetical protein
MGESVHSSLSLLSNILQLLSYTGALDPCHQDGRLMMLHQHYYLKACAAVTVNRAGLTEQKDCLDPHCSFENKGGNRIKVTKSKLKIKGKPRFPHRPPQNAGPAKREFVTKVVGLQTHTFDIGNAKCAAKYQKSVEAIANHVQKEYKGGPEIAKAIRQLNLPMISNPN